jgi:hypothetical protein
METFSDAEDIIGTWYLCVVTGAVILKEWKGEMIHILSRRINVGTCVFVFFDRCCRKRTVSEISDPNCQYSDVHSIIQRLNAFSGVTVCRVSRPWMRLTSANRVSITHTGRATPTYGCRFIDSGRGACRSIDTLRQKLEVVRRHEAHLISLFS